jgi:hypothetical protein
MVQLPLSQVAKEGKIEVRLLGLQIFLKQQANISLKRLKEKIIA